MTSQVMTREWAQEWYATGDPTIRKRAKELRRLNVRVNVCAMGRQITDLGAMTMTLIDIRRNGVDECVWDAIRQAKGETT